MSEQNTGTIKTTLKGSWVAKMVVFFVVLVGLAGWGYLDAAIVYPKRGWEVVEYTKLAYLAQLNEANLLYQGSVEDPAAAYAELNEKGMENLPPIERAQLAWMTSISRVANLSMITEQNQAEMARRIAEPSTDPVATPTLFASAGGELKQLESEWANKAQPKPLSAFDLPVQWLIMFAGIAGALWVAFLFLKAKATSFSYKPETHELTLPGGKSFTPDMIEVVDKRTWDKFFVFLKVQGIANEIKLDLLKFVPLEEWILEMEKLSPNYEPEEESGSDEGGAAAASDESETEHAQSA